ncbi:hypothetical protein LCGC14_1813940, partial [marine sediment metagenome]
GTDNLYYMGDRMGIGTQGPTQLLHLQDVNSSIRLLIEGKQSNSAPAGILFSGDTVVDDATGLIYIASTSGSPPLGPSLNLSIDAIVRGFVAVDNENITGVTAEDPAFVVKAQTLSVTDGSTITNQRQVWFRAPTINGVGGGGTETITNAATVYIDGAPSGSNITFTNGPYALWIDDGALRVDGNTTVSGGDLLVADDSPHAELCDTTDGTAWQIHYDESETFNGLTFWKGTNANCTSNFAIANTYPTLELQLDGDAIFNNGKVGIGLELRSPAENLHVAGNAKVEEKLDIGVPGTGGGLDVGEGGSYKANSAGVTIVRAFTYDASATSGSRFTEISDLDAQNTLLGAAGDRVYVGSPHKIWAARFEVGVAKSSELLSGFYWNGSALTAMTFMGIKKDTVVSVGDNVLEQISEKEYIVFDQQIDADWATADNQTDTIPNTGENLYWIALQVPVGGFATPPRVDEIRVRGSDSDFVTGTAQYVMWGKSRVEIHTVLSAFTKKAVGQPAVEDIAFTSTINVPLLALRNSQSDSLELSFRIPDELDTSCKMEAKLDWLSDDSGEVDFIFRYYVMTDGTSVSSGDTDTASVSTSITPTGADQIQIDDDITTGHTIDVSTLNAGDLIVFELVRSGGVDTNSGKVYAVNISIDWISWTLGEQV